MSAPSLGRFLERALPRTKVRETVAQYRSLHDEAQGGDVNARRHQYAAMTSRYYDLVTDFYEYGWGPSFHFAPGHRGESFAASLARQEMYVALWLGLGPGVRVLDVGCGVGGPMRTIARFSGAHITGLNRSAYQLLRARRQNDEARLSSRCDLVHGDFMDVPLLDGTFDAAYQIEATAHAPDRRGVFAEIFRVLKPGARFVGFDWCLTDRYDPENADHRAIKKGIEEGSSLPDIPSCPEVVRALVEAGFVPLESHDHAFSADPETPWWAPLAGGNWWTAGGFRANPVGRAATHAMVRTLELIRVLPAGATEISSFLQKGAGALVRGGQAGIFTPMFFYCAQKPR